MTRPRARRRPPGGRAVKVRAAWLLATCALASEVAAQAPPPDSARSAPGQVAHALGRPVLAGGGPISVPPPPPDAKPGASNAPTSAGTAPAGASGTGGAAGEAGGAGGAARGDGTGAGATPAGATSAGAGATSAGAGATSAGAGATSTGAATAGVTAGATSAGAATGATSAGATPAGAAKDDPVARLKRELPFDISLGALFYQIIPVRKADSSATAMHFSYLTVEKRIGPSLFHIEARFRDRKFRPFYDSNVWLVESYAQFDTPQKVALKFGKITRRFGIHSDRTLVGNVEEFNGLKYNRDLGLSVEGKPALGSDLKVDYALQYFPLDGGTNTAYIDRGTISVEGGGREKHIFNARIVPTLALSSATSLELGASAQDLEANLPEGPYRVRRVNAEATLQGSWAALYGEITRQWGRSTSSYPLPGGSSDHLYVLAGVELKAKALSAHANYSAVRYLDVGVQDHELLQNVVLDVSPLFFAVEHWWLFQRRGAGVPGSNRTDAHSVALFFGALF